MKRITNHAYTGRNNTVNKVCSVCLL